MNKTSIEWVRNPDSTQGYTWNPITGCLNHVNGLCNGGDFPCYAYRLANGRLKQRYLLHGELAPRCPEREVIHPTFDPFYPRFWDNRLDELNPVYGQDNRAVFKGIFVCDMSDLFGIGIPEEWTAKVLNRIEDFPYHRFYLLTKQPQNLIKWTPFPDNCWVGVTAASDAALTIALTNLAGIGATVKYISFEPLLGSIQPPIDRRLKQAGVGWVIIGAQTKPYKPPKIEWVKEIVEAAVSAGIPVFLKNNLEELSFDYKWPEIEKYWSLFDRIDHVDDFILGANMRQVTPSELTMVVKK